MREGERVRARRVARKRERARPVTNERVRGIGPCRELSNCKRQTLMEIRSGWETLGGGDGRGSAGPLESDTSFVERARSGPGRVEACAGELSVRVRVWAVCMQAWLARKGRA